MALRLATVLVQFQGSRGRVGFDSQAVHLEDQMPAKPMDEGAGRYFGTLYGVLALLKSKGLAGPEDMNDLIGYADLATESIMKVVKLSREIAMAAGVPPPTRSGFHFLTPPEIKPPPERLRQMHEELLEAVADLETMAGPTAIVDKLTDAVSDHMNDMAEAALEKRKSRFKVLAGGSNDGGRSDSRAGDNPRPTQESRRGRDDGPAEGD